MQSNIETISAALVQAMLGEPVPSFRTAEFRETLAALTAEAQDLRSHETIGRAAMDLLLVRLQTAMLAERALHIAGT